MSQHKAAFLPGPSKPLEVSTTPTPSPGAGEVLIKVQAIAVNPIDWKIQDYGILVKSWPAVIGSDASGEIVEVGPEVKNLKKGQKVATAAVYMMTGKKEYGSYQEYMLAPENAVIILPDSVSVEQGAVIPLSASTAAAGLYEEEHLGLSLPNTSSTSSGKKLLVWGGASSVGTSVIQLGVASGLEVIATASPKNFDLLKKLGASKVFDYNSPSVVGDLTAALSEGKCVGAYDAVSSRDTQLSVGTILAQLGGGKIAGVLDPPDELPASVTSKSVFSPTIFFANKHIGQTIFNDYLPQALASGKFVPAPEAQVVGSGVESLQEAMQKQKAGVSARKIVVTL